MSSNIDYRVDVVPATPDNKYTVPCGMNSIVALSGRPITKQTWSIPAGRVAIYSRWVGQRLTGEYVVTRVVHATKVSERSGSVPGNKVPGNKITLTN